MKTLPMLVVLIFSICGFAENHFNKLDALKGNEIKGYLIYKNISGANGLLVLLDGFPGGNDDPEKCALNLFKSTRLAQEANTGKMAAIVIPYYRKLFLDDSLFTVIQTCIADAIAKFQIAHDNFVIGGFSAGGNIAVGYAERIIQEKINSPAPRAVFGVDPPLDLAEMYKYFIREIDRNCTAPTAYVGINEAKDLKAFLEHTLGNPKDSSQNYLKYSPYTMSAQDGGNAKFLLKLPIRLYHEVDPMWYIKERCRTLNDENVTYGVSLIHFLYLSGNKNAEVIITQNRGHRADGQRHPHSWSIVDEKECIKWVKSILIK
jgi:hypothetical protein